MSQRSNRTNTSEGASTNPLTDHSRLRDGEGGEADVGSNASSSPQQWAQHSTSSNQHPRRQRQRTTTFEDEGLMRASIGTENANILATAGDLTENVITNQSANPRNSHRGNKTAENTNNNDTNTTTTFAPEDDETATTTDVNFTLTDRRTGTSAGLVEDFDASEDPDATGNESTTTGPDTATDDDDEDIVTATSVATTAVSTVRAAYHRHSGTPQKKRVTSPPSPIPKHVDPNSLLSSNTTTAATAASSPAGPEENVPLHFGDDDDTQSEESLSSFASSSDGQGGRKRGQGQRNSGQQPASHRQSPSNKVKGKPTSKDSKGKTPPAANTQNDRVKSKGTKEDDEDQDSGSSSDSDSSTASQSSGSERAPNVKRKQPKRAKRSLGGAYVGSRSESEPGRAGNAYFGAYGDLAVHQLMLSDGPRMNFYHSILGGSYNTSVPIEGSVVVEVGCGSGVLSVWASKFGKARRVIAFEGSTDMATLAAAVASENGVRVQLVKAESESPSKGKKSKAGIGKNVVFQHKETSSSHEEQGDANTVPQMVIVDGISDTVVEKGIESFINRFLQNETFVPRDASGSQLPFLPVSVVYSEWMGFYLLHECMLPSVIRMRRFLTEVNKEVETRNASWLKTQTPSQPTTSVSLNYGPPTMVPNHATLYVAPITLRPWYQRRFATFWSNISPNPHPRYLAECLGDHGINNDINENESVQQTAMNQKDNTARTLSMNVMAKLQLESTLVAVEESCTPLVEIVPSDSLLHEPKVFATIDLQRCSEKEALECVGEATFDFGSSALSKKRATNGDSKENVDGFCVWFDVSQKSDSSFSESATYASIPTGPLDRPTHWKQSTMLIPSHMRGPIPTTVDAEDSPLSIARLVGDKDKMQITVGVKRIKGRQYTVEYELS